MTPEGFAMIMATLGFIAFIAIWFYLVIPITSFVVTGVPG